MQHRSGPWPMSGSAPTSRSEHGLSLDAQQAKLAAYATLYELDLVAIEVDAGVSAKTLQRPALQRALGALKAGQAEALLVVKLDRLTRSVKTWGCWSRPTFWPANGR